MSSRETFDHETALTSEYHSDTSMKVSPIKPTVPSTSTIPLDLYHEPLPARRAKMAAMLSTKAGNFEAVGSASSQKIGSSTKRPARDSKRRATHSQIERRRREKINDRLVTLRTIVPACTAEVEERKRVKREEEEEARKIAAGEITSYNAKGKRRRNRRKASTADAGEKEDELGLHKLDVLTHTIEYIYELQDRIEELEKGVRRSHRRKVIDSHEMEADDGKAVDIEDEEDNDSDADLEMSDWKPTSPRKLSESVSPAVMSLAAESPMFSNGPNSSASAFTNLTSPMMSLSSDSPILRWDSGKDTTASPPTKRTRSGQSLDLNNNKKVGSSVLTVSHGIDWRLPAPALPLEDKPKLKHRHTCSGSQHHLSTATSQMTSTSASQDAHLLLNLSTSPESLRPISAIRHSFDIQRRKGAAPPMTSIMTEPIASRNSIAESAPGGALATSSAALLVSPPLLALDAPISASRAGVTGKSK